MKRKVSEVHPVDVHVGTRLKWLRKKLGVSQEKIAEATNVTFQQIQKYEKGENRISCGKLYDIARFLKVRPSFFFGQLEGGELPYNFVDTDIVLLAEKDANVYGEVDAANDKLPTIEIWKDLDRESKEVAMLLHQVQDQRIRENVVALLHLLIAEE